jgi:hypothetical protein
MNIWENTFHTRPAWNGATLHIQDETKIVWDGSSRFYALETARSRLYSAHIVEGLRPEPNLDKRVSSKDFEIHYVGNILNALQIGYNLGAAPGIDDGK